LAKLIINVDIFPMVYTLCSEHFYSSCKFEIPFPVQSAKFSPKQLLQVKQILDFLSYTSFHFSYSTLLFLHFTWDLLN